MASISKNIFKECFFAGLFLSFFSFFLDYYQIQGLDEGKKLLVSWGYNIFIGWHTTLSEKATLNTLSKPISFQVPLFVTILSISMLALSFLGGVLNITKVNFRQKNQFLFSYANFFLIILISFYVFVFPVFYLFPNDLYFPFLTVKTTGLSVTFYHNIGPGYIFQTLALFLIFPYAFFFHSFSLNFSDTVINSSQNNDNRFESMKEFIDINNLIVQEELKLKSNQTTNKEQIKRNDPK